MKKLLILLIVAVIIFTMISCDSTEPVEASTIHRTFTNGNMKVEIDKETGVNYIVYKDRDNYALGIGICPRYNADGTLYVSEVE